MASFFVIAETKFSFGTIIPKLPRCSCSGHRPLLSLVFFPISGEAGVFA